MRRRALAIMSYVVLLAVWVFIVPAFSQEKEQQEQLRHMYGPNDLRKLVAVVKTPTPPKIDGIMEKNEWDSAAAVTGLTANEAADYVYSIGGMQNVAADQGTFWITYDDERLYIAHHSPPPARIRHNPALVAVMLNPKDRVRISIVDPYPYGDDYWIFINEYSLPFKKLVQDHGSSYWSRLALALPVCLQEIVEPLATYLWLGV